MNNVENQIRYPSDSPEGWVILKIENSPPVYKVFGSWTGGYLKGDSWRINSGISRVEEDLHYYYFYGYSGSCYKCKKNRYGAISSWNQSVLNSFIEKSPIKIKVLDSNTKWINLINEKNK
jgi:hypothetical protein